MFNRIEIRSVDNGFVIELYNPYDRNKECIAEDWKEVIDIVGEHELQANGS